MKSPNIFPDPYVTLGTVENLERRGPKTTRKGWETIVGPRLRPHICCNGHVAFSNWLLTKTWLGTGCRSRVSYWNWTWGGSWVRVRPCPCPTTLAYTFFFLIGKQKKTKNKKEKEEESRREGEREERLQIQLHIQCNAIGFAVELDLGIIGGNGGIRSL